MFLFSERNNTLMCSSIANEDNNQPVLFWDKLREKKEIQLLQILQQLNFLF